MLYLFAFIPICLSASLDKEFLGRLRGSEIAEIVISNELLKGEIEKAETELATLADSRQECIRSRDGVALQTRLEALKKESLHGDWSSNRISPDAFKGHKNELIELFRDFVHGRGDLVRFDEVIANLKAEMNISTVWSICTAALQRVPSMATFGRTRACKTLASQAIRIESIEEHISALEKRIQAIPIREWANAFPYDA